MNMRSLMLCVMSLGVVNGCLGSNSILQTAERNTIANALVAQNVKQVKKMYKKAASIAKGNQIFFKVITGITCGVSAPISVPYFVLAGRRARMYRKFAEHADVIYALLQSPEFKKHMGVTDWSEVRRIRRKAETAGITTQFVATVPAALVAATLTGRITKNGPGAVAALVGTLGFGMFGIKPIIAKAIRKKGGVPELEKEFEKAIEMYERTGVVPYGAILDTSRPTCGAASSTTHQDSGMQSTSYAVESARDTYLRLLAERAAAKKEAAQEASESAQD
jgi:hypothetical protein